jgi:hypothetical protein
MLFSGYFSNQLDRLFRIKSICYEPWLDSVLGNLEEMEKQNIIMKDPSDPKDRITRYIVKTRTAISNIDAKDIQEEKKIKLIRNEILYLLNFIEVIEMLEKEKETEKLT